MVIKQAEHSEAQVQMKIQEKCCLSVGAHVSLGTVAFEYDSLAYVDKWEGTGMYVT